VHCKLYWTLNFYFGYDCKKRNNVTMSGTDNYTFAGDASSNGGTHNKHSSSSQHTEANKMKQMTRKILSSIEDPLAPSPNKFEI
jgi:hypothetical protein